MKRSTFAAGVVAGLMLSAAPAFAQDTTAPTDPTTAAPADSTAAPAATYPQDSTAAPAATYPQDSTVPAPADQSTTAAPTDTSAAPAPTDTASTDTAPDGSKAFGIEPYLGVMGGYHEFDSDNRHYVSTNCNGRSGCPDGGFVEAVGGVNVPLNMFFIGAEGNVARGFKGLKWEYGAYGRVGVRAGDSGLLYLKAGYQWVHSKEQRKDSDAAYGLGVEVGPKDIGLGGITGNAGVRLRLEVSTFDFASVRPAAGAVFHF